MEQPALALLEFDSIAVGIQAGDAMVKRAPIDEIKSGTVHLPGGPGKPADMNKEFIGKNASVLLAEIGVSAGPEVRQIVVEVDKEHPVVWSEQMMPIMPVVRVANADEAIDLAIAAEHGFPLGSHGINFFRAVLAVRGYGIQFGREIFFGGVDAAQSTRGLPCRF